MRKSPGIGAQAGEVARWPGAQLVVILVLGSRSRPPAGAPSGDVIESSHVHSRAVALGKEYGVEVSWEVLHGDEPEKAIADCLGNDRGAILAMLTRANAAPVRAALPGGVMTGCLRKAGVPILMRLP